MARKTVVLGPKYGELTVLSEVEGARPRMASVQCSCGAKREVRLHDLARGRINSCGKGACKQYKRRGYDPKFSPRGPETCSMEQLQAAWAAYSHRQIERRKSANVLAEEMGIPLPSLTEMFSAIRRAGGFRRYKSLVNKHGKKA